MTWLSLIVSLLIYWSTCGFAQSINAVKNQHVLTFSHRKVGTLQIEFYTDFVIRVRRRPPNEEFFAEDRYPAVISHQRSGEFNVVESEKGWEIAVGERGKPQLLIEVDSQTLSLVWKELPSGNIFLQEKAHINRENISLGVSFLYDPQEHFCGMGHQAFGLVESLDLKGRQVSANYGEGMLDGWGGQGVLSVPFYMSDKGYGVFLNSGFPHKFNFGKNGEYNFGIDPGEEEAELDFFLIYGPGLKDILRRYVELTGKPRLPPKSIFGLHLSDKGNPENDGVEWWKDKITAHREAGFPFDHIVNDNRWRAGTGAWSGSWFEWDSSRYPGPKSYAEWYRANGLTMTLDLNRNICAASAGYKPEYNLPLSEEFVKEGFSAPDYTDPGVRNWLWELFWNQSFNPALEYPGDAIWIDETDELYTLPDSVICADGRSWRENKNLYQYYVALAATGEGWDNMNGNNPPGIGDGRRPYVWIRGGSAGGQRYATHWTGDLECDYDWMAKTVRAMQASGLSGFPYFNHDAGGFRGPGPDDAMYIQWAMAFGSFSPIWRPHGFGENKRWPLDRSQACQNAAHLYGELRYGLFPYIYTLAHLAHEEGLPMARALFLEYPEEEKAWSHDLQYLWGRDIMVAPNCSGGDTLMEIWLPPEKKWYAYFGDEVYAGDSTITYPANIGELPLFIRSGAIIPGRKYAQSSFWLEEDQLILDIYTGENGRFILYEDDGVSEYFRTKGELRKTEVIYNEEKNEIRIKGVEGNYVNAPEKRNYEIILHGMKDISDIEYSILENNKLLEKKNIEFSAHERDGVVQIILPAIDVKRDVWIKVN